MPKQYDQRVRHTNMGDATAASVLPQNYAAPVAIPDTGGYNAENDVAGALLKGLSALNPALGAMADREAQLRRAKDIENMRLEEQREGQMGRITLASGQPIPPESTVAFTRSYMAASGDKGGHEDSQEYLSGFEAERSKDGFDFHKYTEEFWKKKSEGLASVDPDFADAYLKRRSEAEAVAITARQKYLRADQHKDTQQALGAAATQLAALKIDGAASAEKREALRAQFMALNIPAKEIDDVIVQAAIAHADKTGDVSGLGRLGETRPGGGAHPLMDPDRQLKVQQATRQILDRQRTTANREFTLEQLQTMDAYRKQAQEDPESIPDASALAMSFYSSGILKSRSEVLSYATDITKIKVEGEATKRALERSRDPNSSRYLSPDDVKRVKDQASLAWSKIDPKSDKAVDQQAAMTFDLYQSTGYVPTELKHALSFSTMRTTGDEEAPAAAERGFQLVERLSQVAGTRAAAAALMDENDKIVMDVFFDGIKNGMPKAEAWRRATAAIDPAAKERNKQLVTPQFRADVRSAANSAQAPWTAANGRDRDEINIEAVSSAAAKVAAGASPEDAKKRTLEELELRQTSDGTNYFLVPLHLAQRKEEISKGAQAVIARIEASNPELEGTLFVRSTASGEGMVVLSSKTGNPVDTYATDDFIGAGIVQVQDDVQASQAFRQQFGGGRTIDFSKVPKDQLNQMIGDLERWRNAGMITGDELATARRIQHKYRMDVTANNILNRSTWHQTYAPKGGTEATERDVASLATKVKSPGGSYKSSTEIALESVKANPMAALVVAAEGIELSRYTDPNGQNLNIGAGYSMNVKDPEKTKSDLRRAGIPPDRVADVMQGKASITPEQAVRLTENQLREVYAPRAKATFESSAPGGWALLTPGERSAMTYIEYATGSGLKNYPKLMAALRSGDREAAVNELTITYAQKGGTRVSAERAVTLARAMIRGPEAFTALLKKGI